MDSKRKVSCDVVLPATVLRVYPFIKDLNFLLLFLERLPDQFEFISLLNKETEDVVMSQVSRVFPVFCLP